MARHRAPGPLEVTSLTTTTTVQISHGSLEVLRAKTRPHCPPQPWCCRQRSSAPAECTGLNTNPQPDSIPGASTLSRSGRGHPGEEPWLCQAPGLPHPGRDLFFIIFGTTGRAAICQAPCPYKYASGSVYGDGWGGGLRWG